MSRPLGRRRVLGLAVAAGAVGLLAPGCSSSPWKAAQRSAMPPSAAPVWAQRPVVDLSFDLADDLRTVAGRERVVFTPDLPVCELVFRAWTNRPGGARSGSSLVVTEVRVDGRPIAPSVQPAGAPEGAPGTLVEVPLPKCVEAGRPLTVELLFTLTLGEDSDERWGVSSSTQTAWFATGFPLLAWVREEGWARDPAVAVGGESATSEQMDLASLEITAPTGYAVCGTGTALGSGPGARPGTTTHRFTAEAVRDVAVATGRFRVLERDVAGVALHLFTPEKGTEVPPATWAQLFQVGLDRLMPLFGTFPYRDLWVTVIPGQSSGLEFPGALQFGDVDEKGLLELIIHELAHQWFYALVGNNQARDPWMDEGFATYAEVLTTGQDDNFRLSDIAGRVSGDLGAPMSAWAERGGFGLYYEGVYRQGAAVLLEARRRAGAERFDAAVRGYIDSNSHRVADRADVVAAFRDVPELIDLLIEYGALPSAR